MTTLPYRKLYISIWAAIIIVTGTYFRTREETNVESLDPLILIQIILSIIAIMLSVFRIVHYRKLTISLKMLFCYIATIALSSIFSPQPKLVIGYWILFTGTSLLTAVLVLNTNCEEELERIEDYWFFIVTFIVIKDSIISLLISQPDLDGQVFRLGAGSIPPNTLSFLAAIAFWMSFKYKKPIIIVFRCIFIVVVLLTQSRMIIASLILVWILRNWLQPSFHRNSSNFLWKCALVFIALSVLSAAMLSISFRLQGTQHVLSRIQRDEGSDSIATLTGRTEIWPAAVHHIFDRPQTFILGHGYGISKFILNIGKFAPTFIAYHAHNLLLETLLSIGLLGFCVMVSMVLRSAQWITRIGRIESFFSMDFILRAASVMATILLYSITESDLAVKISPASVIFLYYFLALDKSTTLVASVK